MADDWAPARIDVYRGGAPAKPGADGWGVAATAPATSALPPAPTASEPKGGWIVKALEPITSYPATYGRMNKEAREQMSEGVSQIGEGHKAKGGWKVATGAMKYLTSPIEAGLHTVVGKPLEENIGIPHEYSEFAAGLALPGYGLSKTTAGQEAIAAARNAGKVLEKIVSPETVDADARAAAASIRSLSGQAARDTEQTGAAIEPSWKKINAMPDADRLDFLSYVEGRSGRFAGTQMRDPALQSLADTLKTEFGKRMAKIQALPSHQQQAFIDDYFPHFWKDPSKAQQAAQTSGGMSRQGSGASLKARTVPTIADGLAMGLEPVTTNPLEATLRYVTSMDRFIASTDVLETAKNAGQVRYIKPQVMGASGHPNSFKVPDGWKPLKGRGSTDASGGQAYAPEGFANVYNNWISRGIHENENAGKAYDAVRHTSNAITGLELGLSGYHFLTVSKAALDNSMANAINLMRKDKPVAAIVQAIKTPAAPFRYARSGKQVKDVYLGLSQGSRELQDTVESLTKAGGRGGPSGCRKWCRCWWLALARGSPVRRTADRPDHGHGGGPAVRAIHSGGEERRVPREPRDVAADPPRCHAGRDRERRAPALGHHRRPVRRDGAGQHFYGQDAEADRHAVPAVMVVDRRAGHPHARRRSA